MKYLKSFLRKAAGLTKRTVSFLTPFFSKEHSEYWKAILFSMALFTVLALTKVFFNWQTYPNGIFQKIPFAVVAVAIFAPTSLFLLAAMFPNMRRFLDKDNLYSFNSLTIWQRYLVSLLVFGLLFLGMVLVTTSL